jgi:poly(hydroxyalkanoate) depolymerase family esterase
MLTWILSHLRRLHTWLLVRLGLWRGRWRRGRVKVAGLRLFPGSLPVRTWRYGLYTPARLRDDEPAPLIVVLHGCRQRALSFAFATGWTDFADRARVRLLCPDQRRLANLFRCWNWFHPLAQRGHGELDVVVAMIDDAATRVGVDPGAVAVVGMSAGGAMAALLAFHHPARFRAVASVAGVPLLGSFAVHNPQEVMRRGLSLSPLLALGSRHEACAPLLVMHGTSDDVVTARCAEQLVAQAAESLRRAGVNAAKVEVSPEASKAAVLDYRAQDQVVLRRVLIDGLDHVWTGGPGGHPFCERGGVPITAHVVRFFRDVGLFSHRAQARAGAVSSPA